MGKKEFHAQISDYLNKHQFLQSEENYSKAENTAPIPFEKELAHTKTYLVIELLRFSSILNVEYDIEVTDFEIPALTLQPIVENAVRYGIRSRVCGGTVTISKRSNGNIYLTVHDDGMGFDVYEKKNDGRSHLEIENAAKPPQPWMHICNHITHSCRIKPKIGSLSPDYTFRQ